MLVYRTYYLEYVPSKQQEEFSKSMCRSKVEGLIDGMYNKTGLLKL